MTNPRRIKPESWLYVSLIGFILFAGFFVLLLFKGGDMNLSMPVYFILVVLIALLSTGFLAGAMRSAAKYQSTVQNRTLMVSGPAVIFFIILYLGYKYRPEPKNDPLTLLIQVMGPGLSNEIISEGSINVAIEEFNSEESINNKGQVYFSGIDPNAKGKEVQLFAKVNGYYLDTSRKYFLDENKRATRLSLVLEKFKPSIVVNGKILDMRKQKGVPGAELRFEGVDSVYHADNGGNFRVLLPIASGTEVRVMISKNDSIIFNSLRVLTDKALLNLPAYE